MTGLLITTFSLSLLISSSSFSQKASEENEGAQPRSPQSKIEFIGGTAFIILVEPNVDAHTGDVIPLTPHTVNTAKSIIERRLNNFGVLDALASVQGNRIQVQIPKMDLVDTMAIEKALTTTAKLTIHKRHPKSDQLAELVAAGDKTEPGYRAYPQEVKDENGKIIRVRHILVARRSAVTGKEIAAAWPDRATNSAVIIELTPAGAKKMEAFTRSLQSGKDHIVSVLDGKVINDATLGADVLSKHFLISGLDNIMECEELAKGLSNPLENDITLIDMRRISASPSTAPTK